MARATLRVMLRSAVVIACFAGLQCGGGDTPTAPTASPTTTSPPATPVLPTPVPTSAPRVFVGAGDIGWCGSPGPEQTARLIDSTIGGTVFTTGDNAYFSGTRQEFLNCYDPSWGRYKSRTRPVPGNHEYETPGALPYFDYFGGLAGPPGLGYYSFELGDEWHAIALNSLVPVNDGSAEAQWLRADLAANHSKCTIAYWHYPLFTSGPNRNQTQMRDFWRILYAADADIVVNGHDHLYERFAPQNPDGGRDNARGIREFIVGTGGASPYNFVTTSANSEARISNTYGVLKFTLQTGSYQWEFIPVSGPSDSGTGSCH